MSSLMEPLTLRSVTLRNRIGMSPMCTYSAPDSLPRDWHLVHLGARAVGGAGLVMTEATAVDPAGRISPVDLGLWSDEQIGAFQPLARFVAERGAVAAIQLAHAGRKAGTRPPWEGREPIGLDGGGWRPIAPSAIPFHEGYSTPRELDAGELPQLVRLWSEAAVRARRAGFQCLEIHMAHGYLLHQFLSPLTNLRRDDYGGTLENRMRFPLEVAAAVRESWPQDLPLLVRISATDWVPGGWDPEQAVRLCQKLGALGVDLIDCSSGGAVPQQVVPVGPGYQVPFAERIRREAGIPAAAVGMITEPTQADEIIRRGQADLVFLGRELLRDPYWPLRAASELGTNPAWPLPYGYAVG